MFAVTNASAPVRAGSNSGLNCKVERCHDGAPPSLRLATPRRTAPDLEATTRVRLEALSRDKVWRQVLGLRLHRRIYA